VSKAETRAFGVSLFFAVDVLFVGGLFFIYAYVRSHVAAWPDVHESLMVPVMLPLLAAGASLFAALLHRARFSLIYPFLGIAVSLAMLGFLWRDAAARGLSMESGRYGAFVFGLTFLWAVHLFGGLLATGGAILRRAGQAPNLGRYLALLALHGIALLLLVFVW